MRKKLLITTVSLAVLGGALLTSSPSGAIGGWSESPTDTFSNGTAHVDVEEYNSCFNVTGVSGTSFDFTVYVTFTESQSCLLPEDQGGASVGVQNGWPVYFTWEYLDNRDLPTRFACLNVESDVTGDTDAQAPLYNLDYYATYDRSRGSLYGRDEVVTAFGPTEELPYNDPNTSGETVDWQISVSIDECSLTPDLPGGFNNKPRQPVTTPSATKLPDTL